MGYEGSGEGKETVSYTRGHRDVPGGIKAITILAADVLTRHSNESTGVTNSIND